MKKMKIEYERKVKTRTEASLKENTPVLSPLSLLNNSQFPLFSLENCFHLHPEVWLQHIYTVNAT
jgi:hypothetical protein